MIDKFIKELELQINLKDFKLNSLLEITRSINNNVPVGRLIEIFNYILKEQLHYTKFVLYVKHEDWECILKQGVKGKVKNLSVEKDLAKFKRITFIESSAFKTLNEFDVVIPVYHKDSPLAYLLVALNKNARENKVRNLQFINFVQTLTNIIVVAIENKRMAKHSIMQERIKKELEVASVMQRFLFPESLPSNKLMDLSAKYIARHEVSGDYYDFFQVNEDEYVMCIADVSGKGISAAMLMANFQATLRTIYNYQVFDLNFLLTELNKKVMKSANGEKFITFFIAHYHTQTRELYYVNAGHNHPILTNGKKVTHLDQGTIGLGMFEQLPFINVGYEVLKPNTTLVMFTDGVVELENELEEQFSLEQLVKNIKMYYPLKMEDLNSLLFSKLEEWKGKLPYVDDTAIFCCRFF